MSRSKKDYNHREIESHWQKVWEEEKTFSPDVHQVENPYYTLMMFPYPSAEGLHVGNMYAFTGADVYGRYMRMQGYDVFEPIGLDGFGIHSENYAIKVGRHPKEQAEISEKNFYRQLQSIGNSFDWERRLETYDSNYYRWTQWLFVQLFKHGLAERRRAEVNFCPNCKTVLADEQVIREIRDKSSKIKDAGVEVFVCERCGSEVDKRQLEQWFFKITDYAGRLDANIDGLDWSRRVKIAQKNWIGKSEGAEIKFKVQSLKSKKTAQLKLNHEGGSNIDEIAVFTTRPDTLYGATFMVVSPEHPFVESILSSQHGLDELKLQEVKKYVEAAKRKTSEERTQNRDKTGVFSGVYAINPAIDEEIPVWIADYVMMGYGTGAIMAVPAHDERDLEFANKYGLAVRQVVVPEGMNAESERIEAAYTGEGVLVNSGEWNGLRISKDTSKVIDSLEKQGVGARRVQYHLRDWLISRQRYWGPPIPMVFCESCYKEGKSWFESGEASSYSRLSDIDTEAMAGWYPIEDEALPVTLPDVEDFRPKGEGTSPLANISEFIETTCPGCGGTARRESDVSDTFLDSAWYFLRYLSPGYDSGPFDPKLIKKWLPVDVYIGGAEHAVLHLLYARFITMALFDMKHLHFEEPFSKFYAHGLIIREGAKMSKSKGNVIVPDEYIQKYGADAFRMYLRFLGPFDMGGDFSDSGVEGMYRFVKRVWSLLNKESGANSTREALENERLHMLHQTIKRVGDEVSQFKFNTAIAGLMEYYNFLSQYSDIRDEERIVFLKLLAPFAPHMTEELYQKIHKGQGSDFQSIHTQPWPQYDEKHLVEDRLTVVVQVNGKRRGDISVLSDEINKKEHVQQLAEQEVERYIQNTVINKVIYVPGRVVNFVTGNGS